MCAVGKRLTATREVSSQRKINRDKFSGETDKAALFNGQPTQTIPLAVERQSWEEATAQVVLPSSITMTPTTMNGVTGAWVSSPDADQQSVLFYLHGGGYTAGSAITHRELAARLCLASGMRLLLINYRLAPEDPFPAAVEDAGNSFRWLLDCGIAPTRIVIGGDSAGGGLALATLLWLRQHHLALPAAALLLSPWLDLALTGASLQSHATVDPLVTKAALALAATHYLANADAKTPLASPLYADLQDLPPLLIQESLPAHFSQSSAGERIHLW